MPPLLQQLSDTVFLNRTFKKLTAQCPNSDGGAGFAIFVQGTLCAADASLAGHGVSEPTDTL